MNFFSTFMAVTNSSREFLVLLVLPGAADGRETGLQSGGPRLHVFIETLQFLGKPPNFLRIHDRLGHIA